MRLRGHFFEWPSRHNVHIALPLFLLLAFFIHALGIVVFSITYPHSAAEPTRSAQVYFLPRDTPRGKAVEPMIEASDPALFSPAEVSDHEIWHVPETEYVASFDSQPPSLAALPEVAETAVTVPLVVRTSEPVRSGPAPAIAPGLPTAVKFRGDLAARAFTPPKTPDFKAPLHQTLAPIEFLVEVSPAGVPVHVFQISDTSGYDILDREAAFYLAHGRFAAPAGAEQPTWGTARFLWGTDVKRGKEP